MPKTLKFLCRRGGLWSALLVILMAAPAAGGQVELVSKANPPAGKNGNFIFNAATSADGRYVAFVSNGPNLVPGQRDDLRLAGYTTANFFLRDRVAGTTSLINHVSGSSSVASASEGALDSLEENLRNLDVSADGRYVAYAAHSTGLVPGQVQPDPHADVFLYDRVTGTNTLISHAAGQPAVTGDLASFDPHISADGNYVVFTSRAGDLVSGQSGPGANGAAVYLYNRATGAISLVSHKSGFPSTAASGLSYYARISGDGGYVTFASQASDLVSGISGATQGNAFLYQRSTGTVSLVSHANGSPLTAIGGGAPWISADGRWIAFAGQGGIFLQDRLTGLSQLITHPRSSPPSALRIDDLVLSANGNVVIFRSPATDLVAGQVDINGQDDLFAFDRLTGKTVLVSHAAGSQTTASDLGAFAGEVSADGRFIAFSSFSRNLVSHQVNAVRTGEVGFDAFLYDRSTAATVLVSHADGSLVTTGNHDSLASGISADGGTVLVGSRATDLAAGNVNPDQYLDLWAYDRRSGDFIPISHRDPGNPAVTPDGPSGPEAISADGRRVLFSSLATGLVPGQVDIPFNNWGYLQFPPLPSPTRDYFLRDRLTGKTTLLSRSSASPPTAIGGHGAILSADGKFAAFERYDPQTGSSPLVSRLFLYDADQDRLTVVSRVAGSPSQYAGDAEGASLSADGRYLVFSCSRCQVIAGMQTPADARQSDLFLYDRVTDGYTLLSHALGSPLRPGNGGSSGRISADGRYVLLTSAATDLIAGQTGPAGTNLFLLDRTTGSLTLVSHVPGNPAMAADGQFSGSGQISADGRWVLFASLATDLVPGQTGGDPNQFHLFLHDRTTGATVLVDRSGSSPLTPANDRPETWAMSADGRWVVFSSLATDLIPGGSDTNQTTDVFLYDRASGAVTLVSHADGSPTTAGPFGGEYPQISADGSRIAFQTPAFILTTGPAVQILLQDRATGARTIAGEVYPSTPIPTRLNTVLQGPLLSADGRQVAFPSASPLVPGDFNLNWDAYVYDESLGNPVTVPPCVLFDGSLGSNLQKVLAVAGSCGVPAGARRVSVKVTARQGSGPGNLRLYPGDVTTAPSGSLRFQKGQTAVSSFDVPLATNGAGTIAVLPFVRGNGTVRVTVEVDGYTP